MKSTFLRAGSREDVIHPGFGVGTDPEKELWLLLFEVAAQTGFSPSPAPCRQL